MIHDLPTGVDFYLGLFFFGMGLAVSWWFFLGLIALALFLLLL